jgi:hypothetical protein
MAEGFIIILNGVPRTFRDQKETACDAARFFKAQGKGDLIEIVDESTGAKTVILADGRLS